MAGLKKKKQDRSGSPNVVLVIFLVFFFLVSIGLGVFAYYGYAGQEELRKARDSANAGKKGEQLAKEYYLMLYRDARVALGADDLDASELDKGDRKEFLSEGEPAFGKFKDEKHNAAAKALMDKVKQNLPGSDKENYGSDVLKELKLARDRAKDWEGKAGDANSRLTRLDKYTTDMNKKNTTYEQTVRTEIQNKSEEQLKIVNKQLDGFQQIANANQGLRDELKKNSDDLIKVKDDHAMVVKEKEREIALLKDDLKKALASGGAQPAGGGDVKTFPLVLDISPGRPLWDHPVGKLVSVNMETRQVVINLGHEHGVKPELTFNIFGPNTHGRAVGPLKGTIEVVKVVNANTSLCRITSLFDAEGREIPLTAQSRFQLRRESDLPLREGDLLYNMFWGTRVAVAGYVSITGEPSDSAAEQKRQMTDFIHLLARYGMTVDAYIDPHDGKIVGSISAKTRYLIFGYNLKGSGAAGKAEEGKEMKDGKEGKEPAKEPAPKDAPNLERNDAINKATQSLKDDAKEFGLLQISAENFSHIIGYRRARSANNPEVSGFTPRVPEAGIARPTRVDEAAPDRPKDEPKKDMEKKDG